MGECPGSSLYGSTAEVGEYQEDLGEFPFTYCAPLDVPFPTVDGQRYFISIAATLCRPPQWGILTGSGNGTQACFRSDIVGVPDWVPSEEIFGKPRETAFSLNFERSTTPVAAATWARIKARYEE